MKKIILYFLTIIVLIGLTYLCQFLGYHLAAKEYLFMIIIGGMSIVFLYIKIAGLKKENPFLNIFVMYLAFLLKIISFLVLFVILYIKTEKVLLGFFILFAHYLVYSVLEIILLKKVKL